MYVDDDCCNYCFLQIALVPLKRSDRMVFLEQSARKVFKWKIKN